MCFNIFQKWVEIEMVVFEEKDITEEKGKSGDGRTASSPWTV